VAVRYFTADFPVLSPNSPQVHGGLHAVQH
jgi:hypothetical protein